MEKLRIKKKEYDIEGIEKDGNLLKIMFSSETDNIKFAGTMDLLTDGGGRSL